MTEGGIRTFITIIGTMSVTDNDDGNITGLYLPNCNLPAMMDSDSPILKKAELQINEYFSGKRKVFALPMSMEGTDFQLKVWNYMKGIPYGKTISYSQIAKDIGHEKAFRAIGTACGSNPIPIIIPCHRVLGTSGLGGYLGGLEMKKKILALEGIKF